jgi:hypothetical protein
MLRACLGKAEKGIAAIASGVAASSGASLSAGDLAADVVFGAVGMKRDLWPVQHHQQLGLVGVEALQQSIQRNQKGMSILHLWTAQVDQTPLVCPF